MLYMYIYISEYVYVHYCFITNVLVLSTTTRERERKKLLLNIQAHTHTTYIHDNDLNIHVVTIHIQYRVLYSVYVYVCMHNVLINTDTRAPDVYKWKPTTWFWCTNNEWYMCNNITKAIWTKSSTEPTKLYDICILNMYNTYRARDDSKNYYEIT